MDDVLGEELVSAGDDGLAGVAAVRVLVDALAHEFRAGGGMDGAVDAAAAAEGGVCGVDDGVYGEGGDVCADEADAGVDVFVGWNLSRGSVWRWELGRREAVGGVEVVDGGDAAVGEFGRRGRGRGRRRRRIGRRIGSHGEVVV